MYRLLLLSTILFFTMTVSAATKTAAKEIEIEAQGATYQAAVNEALVEAIARVHGKTISSEKLTESLEVSASDGKQQDYFAADAYQSQVREKTQGMVLGFDVINSEQISDSKWSVTLNVKVADYKKSASADRQRIAVLPFRTGKNAFHLAGQSLKSNAVTSALNTAITEKLVTTRKFAILDREFDDAARDELSRLATTSVAPAELARLNQGLIADYLLVGTIDALNFDLQERTMRTSDKKFVSGHGQLKVSFRLIEVATSQIVFSGSANSSLTDKNLVNGVHTAAGDISHQFTSKVATAIVRDTTDQIYPLTIVGKQGDEVIISEGSSTLKVGQRYEVFRRLEKIIDPYTNELTGWSEEACCELEITRVTTRLSYGRLTKQPTGLIEPIKPKTLMLREVNFRPVNIKKTPQRQQPVTQKESKDW
ncbi:MAG: CsgG/HfaB family protein [Gammaproteobacteria bacterium]|nr:CsgG/HfaB family protein [Gammaproteobacteria bacterium]MBU2224632.1 CsgG/HfaB family protein [Gammaproteobacteria bacterium]